MTIAHQPSPPDPLDERLLSQAALTSANDALRSLCARFAPTFVAVERRDVRLEECLDTLLSRLERASEAAAFAEQRLEVGNKSEDGSRRTRQEPLVASSLSSLAERHRLRRRTLLQHSSLLELLELPALMDACLRAGLYDEALAVAAFGNALERRHSVQHSHSHQTIEKVVTNSAESSNTRKAGIYGIGGSKQKEGGEEVIFSVVSSLRSREKDLRLHLLSRLRGSITMPHCLEIVTALRRLNGVELERKRICRTFFQEREDSNRKDIDLEQAHSAMELQLMVEFFEARDSWLRESMSIGLNCLSGAGRDATSKNDLLSVRCDGADSEVLLNVIDRIRTRTFEVATQFIAIFCGASSQAASSQDQSLLLLSMWLTRRIQYFLSSLKTQLGQVKDAATLRDVLDATNFFASSMGRVGSDFQCLLPPIFEDRLSDIVLRRWSDGAEALDVTLKVCRDAGIAGPLMSTASTSEISGGEFIISSGDGSTQQGDSSETGTPWPPRKLLASPPLARFVNSFLDGLNEARRCLLPGSAETLRSSSFEILAQVDALLQANERAVLTPGLRGEALRLREAAARMKSDWMDVANPFCTFSIEVALGNIDRISGRDRPVQPNNEEGGGKATKQNVKVEQEAKENVEVKQEAVEYTKVEGVRG